VTRSLTADGQARLFMAARAILERDGWVRPSGEGDHRFDDRRRTLLEALEDVVPWDGVTPRAAIEALALRIGVTEAELAGASYADIEALVEAWDDYPGRGLNQVLGVLS
jgi:hypothetical protein